MFNSSRPWVAAAAAAALLASFTGPPACAETIVVGDQVTVRHTDVPHPKRGMSMAQVEKHFGEPRERHPTVGTPPITRWDYDSFAVFFEKDLVIDAVVPGATLAPGSAPAAAPIQAAAPAAAPATAPAPAAAPASADAQKAGSAPKSAAPLSDVSLHH